MSQKMKMMQSIIIEDYDSAFINACTIGDLLIVKLMIEKDVKELNSGFIKACMLGHTKIVELLIENNNITDLTSGFMEACANGHTEIVELFIEKGMDKFDLGLGLAVIKNHPCIINIFLEKNTIFNEHCLLRMNDHSFIFALIRQNNVLYQSKCMPINDALVLIQKETNTNKYEKIIDSVNKNKTHLEIKSGFSTYPNKTKQQIYNIILSMKVLSKISCKIPKMIVWIIIHFYLTSNMKIY